jgi:hypothetical protein
MQLKKALEDKNLDVRVRDRLIAEGKISKKDLDKSLAELKDSQSDLVVTRQELKKN